MNRPDRIPPHNAEAERGVLGSILLDNSCLVEVRGILSPEHFYLDSHRQMYAAAVAMDELRKPVDATLLADALHRAGKLEEVGGVPYIVEIINCVPHAAHAAYYAGIVRDKWRARMAISAATDVLRDAYEEQADMETAVAKWSRDIRSLEEGMGRRPAPLLKAVMGNVLQTINTRQNAPQGQGFSIGFSELSRLVGKLQRSNLLVIAGRPSMGKSALSQQIAEHIAEQSGEAVLEFSLEQSEEEIGIRAFATRTRIDSRRLRDPRDLSGEEMERLIHAEADEPETLLTIDDSPDQSLQSIDLAVRLAKRRGPVAAFVVDYLQLVEPADKRAPREQQVAAMTRGFKKLAKREDVLCIVLAQLNREADKRPDKRPKLSDLRESGAIEQDADGVLFVHRPEMYDAGDRVGEADIVIAKNRNGPLGVVMLKYDKEAVRFVNPEIFVPDDPFTQQAMFDQSGMIRSIY